MKIIKNINRVGILAIIFIFISGISVFAVTFSQLYITGSKYYTSSNENAVYVSDDYIYMVGPGTATVTAADDNSTWNLVVEGEGDSKVKTYVEFLQSFPNSVANYSDKEKVKALLKYMSDHNFAMDQSSSSKYNLLVGQPADCNAYATICTDTLRRCGIDCEVVAEGGGSTHVYNKIYVDNKWYNLDASLYIKMSSSNRQYYIDNLFNDSNIVN